MKVFWKLPLGLSLLAFAAAMGACSDDDSTPADSGVSDGGTNDGSLGDASTNDGSTGNNDGGTITSASFTRRVITTGLRQPFELAMGPDNMLWVTERTAGQVTRVDPATGEKNALLNIDDILITPETQDGLLGMAFHPELGRETGNDHVFLAYTYDADPGTSTTAVDRRVRIVRYTWDSAADMLRDRQTLIEGLHGSVDHNSGRIAIGPDMKLYYTIGDQGANQLSVYCEVNRAQQLPTEAEIAAEDYTAYQGKILRMELDGSIPADNPELMGVRSHIYSYGHRNAQGLAFGPTGMLYEAEHGPKTDDELNLIRAGMNYGWPRVAGYQDNKAYVWANWSASTNPPCAELEYSDFAIPPSVPVKQESDFDDPLFTEPLATFYTVETGFNFMDPLCAENEMYFICWPTIAPSSIQVYSNEDGIPGWADSILITTLKDGAMYRMKLDANGGDVSETMEPFFESTNRYRDVEISADGKKLFLITDTAGLARDQQTMRPTTMLDDPGAMIEFSYNPATND